MSQHQKSSVTALAVSVVALVAFAADQYTKRLVQHALLPNESRVAIPHLLRWTYERNYHGAFGLFGSNATLLVAMAVLVLVLFWISFREAAMQSRLVRLAFGLIVGGAIGNIVDRIHFGYVVDFIDFYRVWPNIFNVGDSCVTIGVVLLLLSSLLASRRRT